MRPGARSDVCERCNALVDRSEPLAELLQDIIEIRHP
jgi:hypothetical protein